MFKMTAVRPIIDSSDNACVDVRATLKSRYNKKSRKVSKPLNLQLCFASAVLRLDILMSKSVKNVRM